MARDPLYSQRAGRPRRFTQDDFAALIWRSIRKLRQQGYFDEAVLGYERPDGARVAPRLSQDDFLRALKKSDIYPDLQRSREYGWAPTSCVTDRDVLFDTIEYLHAEAVSRPTANGFSREEGRQALRESLNPDLALAEPPMELTPAGRVVDRAPDELKPLLEEPVPEEVPSALRDPLRAAIDQYRRRDATLQDKRSALKHLADVLEPLRDEIDEFLLPKDESALFQIANGFHIRHNSRTQARNYDTDVWLDWMFYVYVATARSLIAVLDRQTLAERVHGPEPDDNGGLPF